MRLQHATWPEVDHYFQRSTGIIIPIGSTEQHGPSGLVGTDAICPEFIAWQLGEADGILVAPTISIGMAQHHLKFPGSITLRPRTLIAVVLDVIASLSGQGFTRLYFLNGHGGNIATVQAAFAEYHAGHSLAGQASPVRLKLANWFQCPGVVKLSQKLFGERDGQHATAGEISVTNFAIVDSHRDVELDPPVAPTGPIHDASDFRTRFPDGRMGSDPTLASAEHGEKLVQAAIADIRHDYRQFLAG